MANSPLALLKKSTPLIVLALALIAQGLSLRAVSRPESVHPGKPLDSFPAQVGPWTLAQEGYVDAETRAVLDADDLLSRVYSRRGSPLPTTLFIAGFLSQRNGKAPHSPKNCLPGAGWAQLTSEIRKIEIPGRTIEVNHYVIASRDARSDVMYWYQSRDRVVASEYKAKMFVMADAIRYNRTDTALVRVITPIIGEQLDAASLDANLAFIQSAFPIIESYLPE